MLAPGELSTPYHLSAGERDRFEQDGFIHLSGVLSPQTLAAVEPELTAKVIDLNTNHLPMDQRTTYQKAFLQVTNLWRHSDVVRALVHSPRLAKLAADLMGVPSVRLYHDQALYKESGGGLTPWHADQYYWPFTSDRTCTIWVPGQLTPLEMGPLTFAAGSHRRQLGRDLPISDESERQIQRRLRDQELTVVNEPFGLGDISVHQGWTFHRSGPNTTDTPRRVMTIIHVDAEATIEEPTDATRGELAYMPGARPGDVPDTPLTPVLFPH